MRWFDQNERAREMGILAVLALLISFLTVYGYTTRTPDEAERERARIILHRIYELEQAYYREYGTYVPVDRETNGELLQLSHPPGRFRYRVDAGLASFVAYAEADLNGDGSVEVWQVDHRSSVPVLASRD